MTTLPHNAPLRLPRPAGGGQLSIPTPVHATPAMPQPGGGGAQLTAGDVWRVLRANVWLIALMVVFSGIAGFFANTYLARHHSRYTATGLLKVSTNIEIGVDVNVPVEAHTAAIELEQKSQATMLMHESLLFQVLQNADSKIRTTKWFNEFANVEDAKEDLLDNLSVSPIPESRLIAVRMTYTEPPDCKTIVDEIVDQHVRNKKEEKNSTTFNKTRPLKERQGNLRLQLEELERRISDKIRVLGHDADGMSVKQFELQQLIQERAEARRVLEEAETKYSTLAGLLLQGQDPPELDEYLQNDSSYNDLLRARMEIDLRMDSKELDNHPLVRALSKKRDTLEEKIANARAEANGKLTIRLSNEYRANVEAAQKMVARVEQQVKDLGEDVKRAETDRGELATLEAQRKNAQDEHNLVTTDLSKLESVVFSGDFSNVDWAQRPQTPDKPSFPRLGYTLAAALALGLALSLGIAFLREVTDNTVRSPRDIARVGQMNLLGMVPHEDDDPQSAGARLPLVIFDAPHSMLAEQFRQVRSRLQHAASLDTTRSLLVTGASAGDGKTVVACNLAAGLALNGRRILLVDANFRRPDIHNVFGLANERGFSDVLNELEAFQECVVETQVPNLSVLPSGVRPSNPTELLESQLLIDFIERALEEYDHVIFDTGPLPLVSETIALAPRVDGVVTVVRARSNSRGLLQRVRDELRKVKAEHLGVVLNAVRSQAGGYYGRNILDYYKYQNNGAA